MPGKTETAFLKVQGFSDLALFGITIAIEAARLAVWARNRWLHFDKSFMWTKKDGSICTLGDKLVTHHIMDRFLRQFGSLVCLTEESVSRYPKVAPARINKKNFQSFFSAPLAASIDGIDGTYFYALGKSFNIWFGLAKFGQPYCSFSVAVGPDAQGIVEIAVAEAGRGAWVWNPHNDWHQLWVKSWDGQSRPNIGHGLPFSQDQRFNSFSHFLCGPNFRGWQPHCSEIVPISQAAINLVKGKQMLYCHALLPSWDWFPLQLFVSEAGYSQHWYRISKSGVSVTLASGPEVQDYYSGQKLCLNIGIPEFVDVVRAFLLGQSENPFFVSSQDFVAVSSKT